MREFLFDNQPENHGSAQLAKLLPPPDIMITIDYGLYESGPK